MRSFSFGRRRVIAMAVSLVLLLSVSVGVVLAYLAAKTDEAENVMVPGVVSCSVNEIFDGVEKKDVSIRNTGNTAAYIRASILVTWQSQGEHAEIYAKAPLPDTDYTVEYGDPLWVQGSDGFWYYTEPVSAEEDTGVLLRSIRPVGTAPEGYVFSVEVVASALQAFPANAVEEAWGVTTAGDTLLPR
ncbi:MAG: hypothetical protein IKC69_00455 [Clostridia bacterium]|nr:hypothetical protein [Clostridia bacterium]